LYGSNGTTGHLRLISPALKGGDLRAICKAIKYLSTLFNKPKHWQKLKKDLEDPTLRLEEHDVENMKRMPMRLLRKVSRKFSYIQQCLILQDIGYNIICFLTLIENYYKKLLDKKKFVITIQYTEYCVTMERVTETLYHIAP
jgi:hypothetical protein